MAETKTPGDIPAWLQLYLAKNTRSSGRSPNIKPIGRPARPVPAKRTTIWLTAGDRSVITAWQDYFASLTDRNMSIGETLSILARICNDRLDLLGGREGFDDLTELTLSLIGKDNEEQLDPNL